VVNLTFPMASSSEAGEKQQCQTVKSRLEGRHSVVLQHVKQSRLSGIVKAKEEDFGVLVQ